jgi:hypothetical protein
VLVQVLVDPRPATAPWFIPMLKPSQRETSRSTRMPVWVSSPISATSSGVAWSYVAMWRYGHTSM